jgi:hypothetical protein
VAVPQNGKGSNIEDLYIRYEQGYLGTIRSNTRHVPKQIDPGQLQLAMSNCCRASKAQVNLGILYWRRGIDPQPSFEAAVQSYEQFRALAVDHPELAGLPWLSDVYVAFSLIGYKTPIEFEDAPYHSKHRWPCYKCCFAHIIQDQPLDLYHSQLLETYLDKFNNLPEESFTTYFQLTGYFQTEKSVEALVKQGEHCWKKRQKSRMYETDTGNGQENELLVDLYLGAALHKIGWQGDSVHCWKWG